MHWSEVEEGTPCAGCGAPISPGSQRGYGVDSTLALCWQCSVDRGGSYDAATDRWVEAPRIDDLAEPER